VRSHREEEQVLTVRSERWRGLAEELWLRRRRWRHTFATRLLNLDVPQEVV